MDTSCIVLGCLLLIQMAIILVMLNPIYDVRKISKHVNRTIKNYRNLYFLSIIIYFGSVIYLGMYIPLQNIHQLLYAKKLGEYDKLVLLTRVEKNYIIAGFSLFLLVVLYGVRALISYASSILEMSIATRESLVIKSHSKELKKKAFLLPENILPNLLRVKRSVSYENILFANELREQLKAILKNAEYPRSTSTISSILDSSNFYCS
ncbi:uncharacterized protein [Epargyreus clarus]|uniref:uncharacterized protein n=1 Tax=Epargyreus clarus TaxID=520877 RepID=UPI003C2BDC33